MRRIGLLLPMVMVVAATATATVAGASDRTAGIQADVERALARLARLDPARELSYGAVEVVPDGGAYGVTVADVALKLAPGDPGLLDVGIVSFRLSPVDGDVYRVDRIVTAPAFEHRGADGGADGSWRWRRAGSKACGRAGRSASCGAEPPLTSISMSPASIRPSMPSPRPRSPVPAWAGSS